MISDIDKYISASEKVETRDIDWREARRVGLTDDELFVLTYFSDIESQTIRYLRTLLRMKMAFRPAISAFLTTWSYEEFFHGYALGRLLAECGHPLEENRVDIVRGSARLNEWVEKVFGPLLSTLFRNQFPAVYMSFGAIQEMTTLRGYERLGEITANPALKTLSTRIARQERRHFAWYFNHAKSQLAASGVSRVLARRILRMNWVPVGAGVKPRADVLRLFSILFPGERGARLAREVDLKISSLPGLQGVRLMEPYFRKFAVI